MAAGDLRRNKVGVVICSSLWMTIFFKLFFNFTVVVKGVTFITQKVSMITVLFVFTTTNKP